MGHPLWYKRFTLIELLVVIVIITVLAGLLMAGVASARRSGHRTSCLSNLKQISVGLNVYLNGHDRLPELTNMPSLGLNDLPTMRDVIDPGSPEVYRCPADDEQYFEKEETSYEWRTALNGRRPTSFTDPGERSVMWDYEPFHGDEEQKGARNALYLDMHVEGL